MTPAVKPIDVLLVEDSVADAELVLDTLAFARLPGFHVRHVTRLADAERALASEPVDVVLLDLGLPDAQGLSAVERIRTAAPAVAIVVRSGLADKQVAIEAVARGVQDYILKSARSDPEALERSILLALARRQAELSERRLIEVVESSDDAILSKDLDGLITGFNRAAERLYGFSAGEVIGRPVSILAGPERAAETAELLVRARAGEVSRIETVRVRRDGSPVEVALTISPIRDSAGRILGASTIARDLTAVREAERGRRLAEQRFAAAFEQAAIGVAISGIRGADRGRFLQTNATLARLVGREPGELDGSSIGALTHPDDADTTDEVYAALDRGEAVEVEKRYLHRDGHAIWVLITSTPVVDELGGAPAYCVTQVLDISERKRFEGQLNYLADHDALTGLYNRRRFAAELDRVLAESRRYDRVGGLLILDLDGFKQVNDRFGHHVGDDLVTRIGGLLRQSVRETDIVARLGGDEFAILFQECDEDGTMAVAEKILEVIRRRGIVVQDLHKARVTTSIGITTFDAGCNLTGEELIVEADIAMYDAKSAGRNRFSVYDRVGKRRDVVSKRHSWLERLRRAIDDDLFVLHAQPIVGICGDGVKRYELLLRMRDDHGDLIPPGAFLYNAERFDLMGDIDRWVLRKAVELLHRYNAQGHDISLSVNLSGRTMNDVQLADDLAAMLAEHPIPRERLVVEVTETAAIVNIERARELARELRRLGCLFALDDFGSGFASFFYLKHLEFDYLKIDGEFVKDLVSTLADQLVVQAVVDIARGLGTKTVAEFVGDDATRDLLKEMGVDYGQGYHLGRPGPIPDLLPPLLDVVTGTAAPAG